MNKLLNQWLNGTYKWHFCADTDMKTFLTFISVFYEIFEIFNHLDVESMLV